jgi:predicted lipid-binding transport protein (Tim44 family)
MQEPFDMTTIVFALLAAFVVWKLRSVLGTRTGSEKPPTNPFARGAPKAFERQAGDAGNTVVALPGAAEPPPPPVQEKIERWKPFAEPGSSAWAGLDSIAAADPAFAIKPFISGAKSAYEMIISAFAEGKREVLRSLLAPEVYAGFVDAIEKRERRGETLSTAFVSIGDPAIEDARLEGRTAKIKIHFTSEMTTATRDNNGKVIEGDPDKAVQVDDIWTFSRDTISRDPNWKLCATESAH